MPRVSVADTKRSGAEQEKQSVVEQVIHALMTERVSATWAD